MSDNISPGTPGNIGLASFPLPTLNVQNPSGAGNRQSSNDGSGNGGTPDTDDPRQYNPNTNGLVERYFFPSTTLPYPGTVGAPSFDGSNVSEFLKNYDILIEDNLIGEEKARGRIIHYIVPELRELVEYLPEYHANDPENYDKRAFYDALKKEFRESDWESLKNSREYLHRIVAKMNAREMTLKEYVITFDRVSERVKEAQGLDEVTRCKLFLQGLPESLHEKILKWTKFEPSDVETYDYRQMLKKATEGYELEGKRRRFVETLSPEHAKTVEEHLNRVTKEHRTYNWHTLPVPPEPAMSSAHAAGSSTLPSTTPATAPVTKAQKKVPVPKASDIDEITERFKELAIRNAQASKEEFQNLLAAHTTRLQNQIESLARNIDNNYSSGGGRGGFRGGFGGNRGRGGSGYPARERYNNNYGQPSQGTSAGPSAPANMEGVNSLQIEIEANTAQGNWQDQKCFACDGKDWEGKPVADPGHRIAAMCPLLLDLQNRGCCYRDPGNNTIYKGTFRPGIIGTPFIFNKDRRWVDQILQQTTGTQWDYYHDKRPENIARMEADAQLAHQEQQRAQSSTSGTSYSLSNKQILHNPERTDNLGSRVVGLTGRDGWTLEDLYDDSHSLFVNALPQTRSKKMDKPESARQLFEQRKKREAKLPKVRGSRSKSNDDPSIPMELDESGDELSLPASQLDPETQSQTQADDPGQISESEDLTIRKKRPTVPFPKTQKGTKVLMQCFKNPNPSATMEVQLRRDLQPYFELFKLAQTASNILMGAMNPKEESLKAARAGIKKTRKGIANVLEEEEAATDSPFETLDVNGLSMDLGSLVRKRRVVGSPKVGFTIHGEKGYETLEGLIDTGAEINMLPTEVAKRIGGTRYRVKHYKLTTAAGTHFEFDGYAEFTVTVAKGVSSRQGFFLFPEAPKILLGQPFILAFRMGIQYNKNGSWSGIFHNESGKRATSTIEILPVLKKSVRFGPTETAKPKRTYLRPKVEEVESDGEITDLELEYQNITNSDSDEEDFF